MPSAMKIAIIDDVVSDGAVDDELIVFEVCRHARTQGIPVSLRRARDGSLVRL